MAIYSIPINFIQVDGIWWLALLPYVRTIISDAILTFWDCKSYGQDGVVAGQVPTCDSSFCPVYRTERILAALWLNPDWRSQWQYVDSISPTLAASEELALNTRIMAYVEDQGLFSSETYEVRRTIARGVFVAVLNNFENPGQNLSPNLVITTETTSICTIFPTPTTASNCPSMTVTYEYAEPITTKEVVSTRARLPSWCSRLDWFSIYPAVMRGANGAALLMEIVEP